MVHIHFKSINSVHFFFLFFFWFLFWHCWKPDDITPWKTSWILSFSSCDKGERISHFLGTMYKQNIFTAGKYTSWLLTTTRWESCLKLFLKMIVTLMRVQIVKWECFLTSWLFQLWPLCLMWNRKIFTMIGINGIWYDTGTIAQTLNRNTFILI